MAKKRSGTRGRSKNFVVLKVQANLTLATLASDAAIDAQLLSIDDDLSLISADLLWAIDGLTVNEGPIEVGLNSDSLTPAQIVEALDASPSNRGDRIALERTGRPVRTGGMFAGQVANENLNNGQFVRVKLRFPLSQNQELNHYAVNRSGATLTTGASVRVSGKIYARWT